MALNDRSDQVVRAFVRSDLPSDVDIPDNFRKYLTGEFDLIQQVLSEANDSAPQVSEAAPASVRKGMVRYAVAPWDPLGTGYVGYVTWNGAAWVKGVTAYTASEITNVPAGGISSVNVQAALNELDLEKLRIDHGNVMTDILGFSQLNASSAAVEGAKIDPFIYVTTAGAESIGITVDTLTAGVLTSRMEMSDRIYFYNSIDPIYVQWTDAGATEGPYDTIHRNSASPAAADLIGLTRYTGKDSAANFQVYASIGGRIDTATSTSEDGSLLVYTVQAGTVQREAEIGKGMVIGVSPTGGQKGTGTLNVKTGYYLNGTLVANPVVAIEQDTSTGATSYTLLNNTLPSTATKIRITFNGVSTNTASQPGLIQLGTGAGPTFVTSGYIVGEAEIGAASAAREAATDGWRLARTTNATAAALISGFLELRKLRSGANTWVGVGSYNIDAATPLTGIIVGNVTPGAAVTSLRLTTPGGAATFDAGFICVEYE
jgi:hypothetical protein